MDEQTTSCPSEGISSALGMGHLITRGRKGDMSPRGLRRALASGTDGIRVMEVLHQDSRHVASYYPCRQGSPVQDISSSHHSGKLLRSALMNAFVRWVHLASFVCMRLRWSWKDFRYVMYSELLNATLPVCCDAPALSYLLMWKRGQHLVRLTCEFMLSAAVYHPVLHLRHQLASCFNS